MYKKHYKMYKNLVKISDYELQMDILYKCLNLYPTKRPDIAHVWKTLKNVKTIPTAILI